MFQLKEGWTETKLIINKDYYHEQLHSNPSQWAFVLFERCCRLKQYVFILIAVDRFSATLFPLKSALISRKVRAALLFVTWLIPVAHCIPIYPTESQFGHKAFCTLEQNTLGMTLVLDSDVAIFNTSSFSGNIEIRRKQQNSLFPKGPVIK